MEYTRYVIDSTHEIPGGGYRRIETIRHTLEEAEALQAVIGDDPTCVTVCIAQEFFDFES